MAEESFTPEQVRLVMRSAGLDPSRSLDDQLQDDTAALQKRIDDLEAQLAAATEKQTAAPLTPHEQQLQSAAQEGQKLLNSLRQNRIGPYGWAGAGDDNGPEAA